MTVVLEKKTLTPVSILIHPGAPSDARIFEGILKELERRGLIKDGDKLYFDKSYFSKENYQIRINIYKIISIIFPKGNFDINRIKGELSYPLDVYNSTSDLEKMKNEMHELTNQIVEILKDWKDLKPVMGIIEDFFKVAKKSIWFRKILQLYRKINGQKHFTRLFINNTCHSTVIQNKNTTITIE